MLECTLQPKVCSPLQVVFSSKGKPQLVLDLQFINQYLLNQKFKYEGLGLVSNMFKLKSGYHHVDIYEDYWTYLAGMGGSNSIHSKFCLLALQQLAMFHKAP